MPTRTNNRSSSETLGLTTAKLSLREDRTSHNSSETEWVHGRRII